MSAATKLGEGTPGSESVMPSRGAALLILTAGRSERIGHSKPLLPIREGALLRRAVETGAASICRPVFVVSGAYAEVVRQDLYSLTIMIACNQKRAGRAGSSLRAAIEVLAASDDIEGTVIMLSDQSLVTAHALNRIVEAHYMTGKDIVASEYEEARGVPLYMGKRFFDEIASLDGRRGARLIIDRHLEDVVTVPLTDAPFDVDSRLVASRAMGHGALIQRLRSASASRRK